MDTYKLKNKDQFLIEFTEPDVFGEYRIIDFDERNPNIMPTAFRKGVTPEALATFIDKRTVSVNRHHMEIVIGKLNLKTKFDMLRYCKGLSLTDSYWVMPSYEPASWKDVNLYTNRFDKALGWMAFTGIPSDVSKHLSTPELTTVGVLPKFWDREKSRILLVKGGTYGYANAALEPISEVCSSVVASAIGLDCTAYEYKVFAGRPTSICQLFTTEDRGLMTAQEFREYVGKDNVTLTLKPYMDQMEFEGLDVDPLKRMIFFDDLVRNSDRHLNNWGFSIDNNTREILGFNKIWDTGESLIAKTMPKDFPQLATSEELFPSFNIYYKGLRKTFYGEQEKRDCYRIQRLVNSGELIKRFKEQGIPDSEDPHLNMICDVVLQRSEMILHDLDF